MKNIDDNANQSQWRSDVLHKVLCNLIHVNLAGGEKRLIKTQYFFSKSITESLICLQLTGCRKWFGEELGMGIISQIEYRSFVQK